MNNKTVNWIIHCCRNGAVCSACKTVENSFRQYACNSHTHGMENYNHPDFQMVLNLPDTEIMRILNTLGIWVRDGRRFQAGEYVKGIYEDCSVRLEEFEETGRTVLRVIIPDKYNHFPEEPECMSPYTLQTLKTDELNKREGAEE